MGDIDLVRLNFNPESLGLLNVILGIVMFGVAMDMRLSDFRGVLSTPKPVLIGMLGQFGLLPAFSYLLILVIDPSPSIALGMMLVAACPGGNISNFLTHFSRGNTALSVTMTAISTAAAIVMTPLNFAFWAGLNPKTAALLHTVALEPVEMLVAVFMLLGVPMAAGLTVARRFPRFAERTKKPMRIFSLVLFAVFVIGALIANWQYFIKYVGFVVFAVLLQNAIALGAGYFAALFSGLPEADRRAVSIEVGIQNSGLGLVLIFNFFNGLGGMAIVTAWWGIWHVISGFTIASIWRRRPPPTGTP